MSARRDFLLNENCRLSVVPARTAESNPLAHLLACLDGAVRLMDEVGMNVDARIIEAHRAELARGHEWPGDAIAPVVFSDGSAS